jgi:hypothetical protein
MGPLQSTARKYKKSIFFRAQSAKWPLNCGKSSLGDAVSTEAEAGVPFEKFANFPMISRFFRKKVPR